MRLSIGVVVLLLLACAQTPSANELVGDYTIDYSYGREKLVLRSSGSYDQAFVAKDGRSMHNTGSWEINRRELLLRNAMDVDDGFGNFGDPSIRMDWLLRPERSGEKVIIVVNPDRKERYEKQR
jgi:hypothetical protein